MPYFWEVYGRRMAAAAAPAEQRASEEAPSSDNFDFSSTFSEVDGAVVMSTADELFHNGQIRPLWLVNSAKLEDPQGYGYGYSSVSAAAPRSASRLQDDGSYFDFRRSANYGKFSVKEMEEEEEEEEEEENEEAKRKGGCGVPVQPAHESSVLRAARRDSGRQRRARSLSPMRVFHMDDDDDRRSVGTDPCLTTAVPRGAKAVSRRSLKDLLAGEERPTGSAKKKKAPEGKSKPVLQAKVMGGRPKSGSPSSAHDRAPTNSGSPPPVSAHALYASRRAHSEQMSKRAFLPYRQGLLGCLGLSSKRFRGFPQSPTRPK